MRLNKKTVVAVAAAAAALAAPSEGLRQFAYYDPPGVLTVCYGSTTNVVAGRKYSLAECKARLADDMREAVEQVGRCHPGLPENVWIAFSDAAYNAGPAIACHSTASKYLAAGNYTAACNELLKWDKARVGGRLVALPGLTARRKKERDLCLS